MLRCMVFSKPHNQEVAPVFKNNAPCLETKMLVFQLPVISEKFNKKLKTFDEWMENHDLHETDIGNTEQGNKS